MDQTRLAESGVAVFKSLRNYTTGSSGTIAAAMNTRSSFGAVFYRIPVAAAIAHATMLSPCSASLTRPDTSSTESAIMTRLARPMENVLSRGDEPRVKEQIQEHLDYLRAISASADDAPISEDTAEVARWTWHMMWSASGYALPVPSACTGPDGRLMYSWDRGHNHLEVEFGPEQDSEFFYRDRASGQLWSADHRAGSALPSEVVNSLRLFL
ncbi:MAG: hypothetical protein SH850_20600 [Planctomycetaceae bacterium]|nr:hypothetical protein [Planctomycetaceae bacterium]